jgi:hypothetical protein
MVRSQASTGQDLGGSEHRHPGAIDQDVDRGKLLGDGLDGFGNRPLVADVARDGRRRGSLRDLALRRLHRTVEHHHGGALMDVRVHDGGPDTRGAPGDHGNLAGQREVQ